MIAPDRRSRPATEARRNARWFSAVAAGVIGGSLLGAAAVRAHDVAGGHGAHAHAAMAEAKTSDYTRSIRTYAIPDVTLVDRNSQPVRLRAALAADEPVILNFVFTTCGAICPVMSGIFSMVPEKLGADAARLRMISISIDPENDTPRQLSAYAKKFHAGPRWQFLTGNVDDIRSVARAFDSYRGDKMNHEPLTLLRGAPGKAWVRIDGFASADDLARELRTVALK